MKRVQEKRRKNSNRVQEKRRKTSKEYKPWTNNTGDEERTKQTHDTVFFFVKLSRKWTVNTTFGINGSVYYAVRI